MSGEALSSQVTYQLDQLFKGQIIETKTKDNELKYYVKLYELNKETNEIAGELQVNKVSILKLDESSKFKLINPFLDLSLGYSTNHLLSNNLSIELGLSLSSYETNTLDWRFIRFGIGIVGENMSMSFSPVMYNIASNIPLITNLWILPYVGYNFNDKVEHFGIAASLVL
jgi:hypothetical protein